MKKKLYRLLVTIKKLLGLKLGPGEKYGMLPVDEGECKAILKRNITKKYRKRGCKICGLTGVRSVDRWGLVHPCICVNEYAARHEWIEYCKKHEHLREYVEAYEARFGGIKKNRKGESII